jgi:K+-transporting ATPase ATPase C chain
MKMIKTAISLFVTLVLIVAIIYPLIITSLAQLVFPRQAVGSLVRNSKGEVIGSELIGQPFSDTKYFWPRPSATSDFPYNPMASGGSNLGPTNKDLIKQISERVQSLRSSGIQSPIPSDLVMASASGLDPHISLEAALAQIPRVAKTRGLDENRVRDLVFANTEGRLFGFLGHQRVNVLKLNLALDGIEIKSR